MCNSHIINSNESTKGYVFYDLETTGLSVHYDQILQVAAIRTDAEFNIIDEISDTIEMRCNRLPWVVPSPQALVVTGTTQDQLERSGLGHFEMMQQLVARLQEWSPAIFIGHNSLRYDEEMLRHSLFSSLHPAYMTSMPDCGRADTLNILKAIHCLQPGNIILPEIDGKPSMRLGPVLRANGIKFAENQAHDALADVRGTIALAKLMRDKAPAIFMQMMRLATKSGACTFLDQNPIFRHITYFGRPEISISAPIVSNPDNPNQIAIFDLDHDFKAYLAMSAEELATAFRAKQRVLKMIKLNAQPMIAPLSYLTQTAGEKIIENSHLARSIEITLDAGFKRRVAEAMQMLQSQYPDSPNPEERLYSGGFPSWTDKNLTQRFHNATTWVERCDIARGISDARLRFFALRIIYAEAPEVLNDAVLEEMHDWVRDRLLTLDHPTPYRTIHLAVEELEAMQPATQDPDTGLPLTPTGEQGTLIQKLDEIRGYYLMMASGHQ